MEFVLTSGGIDKLLEALAHDTAITVASFRVGDAGGYVPGPHDTGLRGNVLYHGGISHASVIAEDTVRFQLVMDQHVGPFTFSEVGIFESGSDTLLALGSLDQPQQKEHVHGSNPGNVVEIYADIVYQSIAQLVELLPAPSTFLPLVGGTMFGPIILNGPGTDPLNPVTLTQLNSAISGLGAFDDNHLLRLDGSRQMTGDLRLFRNASQALHAVPYQQLQSYVADRISEIDIVEADPQIHVSPTAPPNPQIGWLWWNPTTSVLRVWEGPPSNWVITSDMTYDGIAVDPNIHVSTTAPQNPQVGWLWWNPSDTTNTPTGTLRIWEGGPSWVLVTHPINVPVPGWSITVGPSPPATTPLVGDMWWNPGTYVLGIWSGSWHTVGDGLFLPLTGGTITGQLTLPATDASGNQAIRFNQVQSMISTAISGASGGASVGTTPPASPTAGRLWWDTDSSKLFVYDGARWIIAVNMSGVGRVADHFVRLCQQTNLAGTYNQAQMRFTRSTNGRLNVDGRDCDVGDRVLLTGQSTGTQNGIYVVEDEGDSSRPCQLVRASDFDDSTKIRPGVVIDVEDGNSQGGSRWVHTTTGTITLHTTNLTFNRQDEQ